VVEPFDLKGENVVPTGTFEPTVTYIRICPLHQFVGFDLLVLKEENPELVPSARVEASVVAHSGVKIGTSGKEDSCIGCWRTRVLYDVCLCLHLSHHAAENKIFTSILNVLSTRSIPVSTISVQFSID
jgi:hypothetical protein